LQFEIFMCVKYRNVFPNGAGPAGVVPDGVEPSFPVCRTGVVAVGPRDCAFKWTHWESHPDLKRAELVSSCWTMSPSRRKPWDSTNKSLMRPAVFKTASSSGRMTSVVSCGSWNRTNIRTFRASRPTVRRSRNCSVSSGGRNRTYGLLIQSQASLPTATTPEWFHAFQECPAGVEPASPAWKAGAVATRPRARKRKE
jgi:hypothetical protein